jgi:hypothetical protein
VPKKSIEDLVADKYENEDVANHILQSVKDGGTADRIVNGELVLPGEADALRNYQIATGTFAQTEQEAKLRDENNKLRERLDAIEARLQRNDEDEGQ